MVPEPGDTLVASENSYSHVSGAFHHFPGREIGVDAYLPRFSFWPHWVLAVFFAHQSDRFLPSFWYDGLVAEVKTKDSISSTYIRSTGRVNRSGFVTFAVSRDFRTLHGVW